jgi:hypothetical protein
MPARAFFLARPRRQTYQWRLPIARDRALPQSGAVEEPIPLSQPSDRQNDRLNAAAEGIALALVSWVGHSLSLGLSPGWLSVGAPAAAWAIARIAAGSRWDDARPWAAFIRALAAWLALWVLFERLLVGSFSRMFLVLALYQAAAVALFRGLRKICPRSRGAENWRWLVLIGGSLGLFRAFLTPALRGAGDALWYDNMLADMLQQVRAGVFPVFAGQGVNQFNGAIYPLRVAPGLHYLGALLDLATFRALEPVPLMNLLIVGLGVLSVLSCYVCLVALAPQRRGLACVFSLLFLACPGVIQLPYIADLYMSWTTVPAVCWSLWAWSRAYAEPSTGRLALAGGTLGLLWWGHTPIALWMTAFAALGLGVRWLLGVGQRRAPWPEIAGAAALLLVAAYPLVSVLVAAPEAGARIGDFQVAAPGNIAYFVKQAFPGVLMPLSSTTRMLSDLQLGYGLWAILLLALCAAALGRGMAGGLLAVFAAAMAVLLTPIPGTNLILWAHVPAFIRNATGNWPMNRLYLVMGALVVWAAWLNVVPWLCGRRTSRLALYGILGASLAWGAFQANRIAVEFGRSPVVPESGRQAMQPENAQLTRFSYFVFPAMPAYYTHGTTDPSLENRLFRRDTGEFLLGNRELLESGSSGAAVQVASGELAADRSQSPHYHLEPSFTLEPGQRYALVFDFHHPQAVGTLVLRLPGYSSFYFLPEFGSAKSFGGTPGHSHLLVLGNSLATPEELSLEFHTRDPWQVRDVGRFAGYRLLRYDPNLLPIRVTSLIPYRAQVTSPAPAWLETPRMYQDAYQAVVEGRRVPIAKSREGLVMIPVPRGFSRVKLQYYPPAYLLASFWASALAAGVVVVAVGLGLKRGLAEPPPGRL